MAVTDHAHHPLVGLGYAEPSATREFTRLGAEGPVAASADVAEEVPIAFVYNGRPHVVVMGTPGDLEDLATGFSITEGIVRDLAAVERVEVVRASHGIELQIQIPSTDAERLAERSRGLVARTGCGLCGIETINDAMRVPVAVGNALRVTPNAIALSAMDLSRRQRLNNATSTVHAAGWATSDGNVAIVREDVGRHNALDKLLGAAVREGLRDGFIVVTSRASYEMVQKVAALGVELIAAISRPTGLAIRFAEAANVTLVGLVRGSSANVYTNPQRITATVSS
ncbi:MAG TPA: formate dehydrogenase accessory sulfurtransferase FdhD [Gemmatimonadaceae bacterium]|nr:formate dehydrogenase accessory sulfurtransferase FdhD [Gemmatimonadaceae bacterium]